MSTVFIVNQPQVLEGRAVYDIAPASEYGRIEYVFPLSFGPASSKPDEAAAHAARVLNAFDAERDYLVWAGGDPLANIIVAGILADYTDGRFTFLKWDKSQDPSRYSPVDLDLFRSMEPADG